MSLCKYNLPKQLICEFRPPVHLVDLYRNFYILHQIPIRLQHFNSAGREPCISYGDGELDPLYRNHQTEKDKSLETRKKHPC